MQWRLLSPPRLLVACGLCYSWGVRNSCDKEPRAVQSQNPLLDDLARVASGALGVAAGMRNEAEARLRDQLERVLARFDLVTREEFEVVKAMAVKAREEQEVLTARLGELEAVLAARDQGGKARKRKAAKPAGKATGKTGKTG